jgi:diguanylate cyclase (GGDEF)-like protein
MDEASPAVLEHDALGSAAPNCASKALAAQRAIHGAIVEAHAEPQLVEFVAKALVEAGGYGCAAVAYFDEADNGLHTAASWGDLVGGFTEHKLLGAEQTTSLEDALRQGRPWLALPPRGTRGRTGGRSPATHALAVLPLLSGPAILGALLVGDEAAASFAGGELDLLQEAAKSLAYGIASLRSAAERDRAEAELRRVERARRTLSMVNRTLVRATDEQALLDDVCRIIHDEGGYRFAWVAYARHDEAKSVEVKAHAGIDRTYFQDLKITWADSERGQGAAGVAIRTGQPSIGRNIRDDPGMAPWRDEALRRGYAAVSAFPLRVDGEVIGSLGMAAGEPDAFDAAEAELLGELAGDLAFGIETLRTRQRSLEADATIKRMAEQDMLTGLPNRWRLQLRLAEEIEAARQASRPLALLVLGVDHFQEINETLGYQQGDAMLREVAARIEREVGQPENMARMGESEFAVLLPDCDAGAASRAAQRLLYDMFEPVKIGEIMLDAGGSIGIAVFPGQGEEPDVLIRRANVAMHRARHLGGGQALYTGGLDRECARRLSLVGDLHRAIDNDELRLYCQPKVRFADRQICGAEALVRWQHPVLGMISPNEFIKLAEHSGLITPLTDWVMAAAFRQSYMWRTAGLSMPLAVNLSARDLRDPKLAERVKNLYATWGAEPNGVQFELTESALMQDPAGSMESLKRLKDLGSELFVDDFGTGYSSLAYLQKLPVDAIKIDQSFVHDMLSDADSAVIVRSTIDLAHDLDLAVVAEGVEDSARWAQLAAQGCDVAQGYVVSEPIPAESFQAWQATGAFEARLA